MADFSFCEDSKNLGS